jgi:HTH-type transcriptional regulator/antitoxin HigA
MTELHPFTPDWTIRPGETLAEILIERHMSTADAGRLTGLRPEEIEGVIHGGTTVDERIAEHLAKLGPSAQFWLNFQANYAADLARGAKDMSEGAGS